VKHARLAAKNLKLEKLPLVVTPHPLNDLTVDQVRELAAAAYPRIIAHLTTPTPVPEQSEVAFVHPADRSKGSGSDHEERAR
jgi:hypothetical protein